MKKLALLTLLSLPITLISGCDSNEYKTKSEPTVASESEVFNDNVDLFTTRNSIVIFDFTDSKAQKPHKDDSLISTEFVLCMNDMNSDTFCESLCVNTTSNHEDCITVGENLAHVTENKGISNSLFDGNLQEYEVFYLACIGQGEDDDTCEQICSYKHNAIDCDVIEDTEEIASAEYHENKGYNYASSLLAAALIAEESHKTETKKPLKPTKSISEIDKATTKKQPTTGVKVSTASLSKKNTEIKIHTAGAKLTGTNASEVNRKKPINNSNAHSFGDISTVTNENNQASKKEKPKEKTISIVKKNKNS